MKLATVTTSPMIFPAWVRARSIWFATIGWTVGHYTVEEHHKEQIRHRQLTIAADKPEED